MGKKNSMMACLAWIFKGSSNEESRQGAEVQSLVSSPLMAEALAIRSSTTMAADLEIPNLNIFRSSELSTPRCRKRKLMGSSRISIKSPLCLTQSPFRFCHDL
ncbi:hypothetical protein IGI04_034697 [Brassica rapa subsp. trilocularis]|uniref:Uncharacterized protein n=1 Tax=Brassica rapa subsp. trilocularis TaxID=1813537 RepID=A0ABQ7L9J2_BRACM|nr:hypothetical protein IGI04_034697 [Brassica rapa subsp. trilocularis]